MQDQLTQDAIKARSCNGCGQPLPLNAAGTDQTGFYCCDEYYCGESCLNQSFEGSGTNWAEHYDEDGDCYYTEWPLVDIVAEYALQVAA